LVERPEEMRRRLEYLPFAENVKNSAGWLIGKPDEEYGAPTGWLEAQDRKAAAAEAATRRQSAAAAREQQDDEREQSRQREQDFNDAMDGSFKQLPEKQQKLINKQVEGRMQLFEAPMRTDFARAMMRRTLLKEMFQKARDDTPEKR
jgi:hypothetical protein